MGNPKAPVAIGTARTVHFCVAAKTAEILNGQNGEAGAALPQAADEMVAGWALGASFLPFVAATGIVDIF